MRSGSSTPTPITARTTCTRSSSSAMSRCSCPSKAMSARRTLFLKRVGFQMKATGLLASRLAPRPIDVQALAQEEEWFMRADIVASAVFPDYELIDHMGKRHKLSDLQGPDPMVLVLSRGGYCPKDLARLRVNTQYI